MGAAGSLSPPTSAQLQDSKTASRPLAGLPERKTVENRKNDRKKYQKPEIVHVEKIEARAVSCAKMVGDDFCETNAPTTS